MWVNAQGWDSRCARSRAGQGSSFCRALDSSDVTSAATSVGMRQRDVSGMDGFSGFQVGCGRGEGVGVASSEPVGDDDNLGDLVDGDDRAQAEYADARDWDEGGDDHSGQHEVLQHDRACPSGVLDEVGEMGEAVAHDRDVGGLDGDVAASCSHGDADIGSGERWCVVDAVADHRDRAVAAQLFDGDEFVAGEQFRSKVVDPGGLPNCSGGALLIAGKHGDVQVVAAAQAALAQSDAVQTFLYDIIRAVNPNDALDAPDTLRDILEQAQTRLQSDLAAQPAVQIEIYGFLRQIREQFGDNPQAIELGKAQIALALQHYGADHEKTAAAQFQLARLLLLAGDDSGFAMLQSAVEALARIAPASLNRAYALVAFASAQSQRGRIDDALGSLNAASPLLLALCADGENKACQEQVAALSHLGIALYQKRDYAAAAAAFAEGASRAEQLYGPVHSMTLRLLGNLATCQVQIDPNTAITTLQRVMRLTAQLPAVAIDTVPAQHNSLGLALSRIGQSAEAKLQFQAALDHIDASQRNGPQQKIFTLNLISEQILLGDTAGARDNLRVLRAMLTPTEDNYIHLARSEEYAAWLDALNGASASLSYQQIESALSWRNREANPRLPDILKTLALGVRIAARHRDSSQAADYLAQIERIREQSPTLPDSVAQDLHQARFELASANGDVAAATAAVDEYAKAVGSFRPNAAFKQLQSMRSALATLGAAQPDPAAR